MPAARCTLPLIVVLRLDAQCCLLHSRILNHSPAQHIYIHYTPSTPPIPRLLLRVCNICLMSNFTYVSCSSIPSMGISLLYDYFPPQCQRQAVSSRNSYKLIFELNSFIDHNAVAHNNRRMWSVCHRGDGGCSIDLLGAR